MAPWLNVGVLVASTILTFGFYVASAGPARLSQRIGAEAAYHRCTVYRTLSGVFMTVAGADYVVYAFRPLPWSFPEHFPWPYWVSVIIAVVIAIPSGVVWFRGMKAAGEVWYWWVFAFLCHSPFLAIYSVVWLPLFHLMSRAEERDLLVRFGEDYRVYMERTGMYMPRRVG